MEKAIKLIQNKNSKDVNSKDIAWQVFLNYHSQVSMFELKHPEEYKKNLLVYKKNLLGYEKIKKRKLEYLEAKKNGSDKECAIKYLKYTKQKKDHETRNPPKRMNTPLIAKCFKSWKDAGFFNIVTSGEKRLGKTGKPYYYPKKKYSFNIEPLYVYLTKTKKLKITDEEYKFLKKIFEAEPIKRKLYNEYLDTDFISAIVKFYIKFLTIPYLQHQAGLYIINKNLKLTEKQVKNFELNNPCFIVDKKNKNKGYLIDFANSDILLSYFILLRKNNKDVCSSLDKKFLYVQNLLPIS